MAVYTADPYNATLPTVDDIAGFQHLELQALKKRLNDALGTDELLPISIKAQLDDLVLTQTQQSLDISANMTWVTDFTDTWNAFIGTDTQYKTDLEASIAGLVPRMVAAEDTVADQRITLDRLIGEANALRHQLSPRLTSGGGGFLTGIAGDISPKTALFPDGTTRTIASLYYGTVAGGYSSLTLRFYNTLGVVEAKAANLSLARLKIFGVGEVVMPMNTYFQSSDGTSGGDFGAGNSNIPTNDPVRAMITTLGAEIGRVAGEQGSLEVTIELVPYDWSALNVGVTLTATVGTFLGDKTLMSPFSSNNNRFDNVSVIIAGKYLDLGIDSEGTPASEGGAVGLTQHLIQEFTEGRLRVRCLGGPTITAADGWVADSSLARFSHPNGDTILGNWLNPKADGAVVSVVVDRI